MINKLQIQGDVALRQIDNLPEGLTEDKARVLALGEMSGHGHTITKQAKLLKDSNGRMYVSANATASLEHVLLESRTRADHDALTLDKGCYEVILQNEYNPYAKEMQRVLD